MDELQVHQRNRFALGVLDDGADLAVRSCTTRTLAVFDRKREVLWLQLLPFSILSS